jgi:hypothetical protein
MPKKLFWITILRAHLIQQHVVAQMKGTNQEDNNVRAYKIEEKCAFEQLEETLIKEKSKWNLSNVTQNSKMEGTDINQVTHWTGKANPSLSPGPDGLPNHSQYSARMYVHYYLFSR